MSNQRNIKDNRHSKIECTEIIKGPGLQPSAVFTNHVGPQPRMEKKLLETTGTPVQFVCSLFMGIYDIFFTNYREKKII